MLSSMVLVVDALLMLIFLGGGLIQFLLRHYKRDKMTAHNTQRKSSYLDTRRKVRMSLVGKIGGIPDSCFEKLEIDD